MNLLEKLPQDEQNTIDNIIKEYRLSFQEQKQLIDIAIDLHQWGEGNLEEFWDESKGIGKEGKHRKKAIFEHLKETYQKLRDQPTTYTKESKKHKPQRIKFSTKESDSLGFGLCPVASPKTRCCNLLTLDAVESCGFDCSYCSIQSFYNGNKIVFDKDFRRKLESIEIDPNQYYHIGTGQSSDSLMWGNREGVLDALVEFAQKYPNVILEFKTKSNNISYFLDKELPPNLLFTWSLNPQIIIDNEEHLTASLDERIKSAKTMADKGALVGFHFHPMIYIEGWQEEYGKVFKRLTDEFDPKSVALVSLGTLTFIKPVIKQIRERDFHSKILQIPMTSASGKYSYPLEIKQQMFKFAYDSLKAWHGEVFFYLCMEDHSLWKSVFGYEYPTNESFEMDMKLHYRKKVNLAKEVIS